MVRTMPGRKPKSTPSPSAAAAASRLAVEAGAAIRAARRARRWTLRTLADASGIGVSGAHRVEAGEPGSLETYARMGVALGLRSELTFTDERRQPSPRQEDVVHAWMGDAEA